MRPEFEFDAVLWRWQGDGPTTWHFLTLPADMAVEIRLRTMGRRRGFGSVRVEAEVGGSRWQTSIFPDSKRDSFILPVKASVRKSEGIGDGDTVSVGLSLIGQ